MTPLAGFAPDADPTAPGVITDCSAMVPTLRGLAGAPSQVAPAGVAALPDDARGAAVAVSTTGTRRLIVGTAPALYELVGSGWVDRSRVGGYSGGTDSRWSIAQFGNATLASNATEPIQASTGTGFADVAGAPKARILCVAVNFVLAFDTSDGVYGAQSDRWWCSALQDHSSWAPSVTTQATTGRLIGEGGGITAAARLGQQVVAYKARSLFVGSYVGAPVVWQWDQVPGDVGCVGPEAVCDIGGAHVFVSEDDILLFDGGSRPVSIADGTVREWFNANCAPQFRYRCIATFDRLSGRVRISFPSHSSSGTPDLCLVYHLGRRAWGRADAVTQCALTYTSSGATFDTIGTTFDGQPPIAFDSPAWLSGGRVPAIVNGANQLVMLAGPAGVGSIVTGDLGNDDGATMLRRARLRFLAEPAAATVRGFTRAGAGRPLVEVGGSSINDSGFDLRQSGRWHRLRFEFAGDVEVTGIAVDAAPAGRR